MPTFLSSLPDTLLPLFSESVGNTLLFLGSTVLPVVILCLVLLFIGRWMNRQLYLSFGWRGVLALAWLGTPVHEFSHVIGCWLGRNRIEDFALFKPDHKTGSLGYVKHSYNTGSFYQRVIGNTLISLAPFFGGSLAIYLLTSHFYPQFLMKPDQLPLANWSTVSSAAGLNELGKAWFHYFQQFYEVLLNKDNLGEWSFWLYLVSMISLAVHLSPSKSDFEGFWGPALILAAALFLTMFTVTALNRVTALSIPDLTGWTLILHTIMALALSFLFLGAMTTAVITLLWTRVLRRGS